MALANYTDLKASVAGWLNRADLTSQIPDFILTAESDFNKRLRTLQNETKASFDITGEFVARPNDFLEVHWWRRLSPRGSLSILPADTGTDSFDSPGIPTYFSLVSSDFQFSPAPDGTYGSLLVYYCGIPPLASNATNWLLTKHPNAYLYGAIMGATGYIQNDPRVPGIKELYDEEINKIITADKRSRWGGNGMAARAA